MVDDPDAMWKPGYVEPSADDESSPDEGSPAPDPPAPPASGRPFREWRSPVGAPGREATPVSFGHERRRGPPVTGPPVTGHPIVAAEAWIVDADRRRPKRTRGGRRSLVTAVAAGMVAAAVAVVGISIVGDDGAPRRPEPGEITGAEAGRLPGEVDELWSTVLPGSGSALASSMLVEGRDLVVAVVDDGSRNRSMIVGVDATTGTTRWRRSFIFAPPEVSLLGVVDGVLLVEQNDLSNRRLLGLGVVDGTTLWERQTAGGGINTVLLGTSVVAYLSGVVNDLITFLDPRTGQPVGDIVGRLLTTDLAGTWYVAQGATIVSIDLAEGWSEPVAVADRGTKAFETMAVVDGRLLATDAGGRIVEFVGDGVATIAAGGPDARPTRSIFPAGGSSFVGIDDRGIFGAELVGDTARTTWRRTADLLGFAVTERGLVLSLGEEGDGLASGAVGGVGVLVVDAVTGDRLAEAGEFAEDGVLPLVVGDGFVTAIEGAGGSERRAYDLNGGEIWSLSVAGKLEVGDELIVVMTNTPAGYALTAYGTTE